MSQYLVTGAAGFIARRVIEKLIAEGHQVVGIDNLNDSYDVRLKLWRLEGLKKLPGFTFLQEDIRRVELFREIAASYPKMDAVIHLAARAGVRAVASAAADQASKPWLISGRSSSHSPG